MAIAADRMRQPLLMPLLLSLVWRVNAVQSRPHICYALPPVDRNAGVPTLHAISKPRGQKSVDANEPEIAASLATRVRKGEKLAEQQIVTRYSRGLLSFLRRKSDDDDLADDLHQDTFRIVLERLRGKGLEDPSHLAGFIHATAKNLVIAHFRKQARRKTEPDSALIDNSSHSGISQSDASILDEQAKTVRSLIAELRSERDREVLLRFYLDEEDKQSICSVLRLTEKHFNRVIFRARERFRGLLLKHEKRSNFRVVK